MKGVWKGLEKGVGEGCRGREVGGGMGNGCEGTRGWRLCKEERRKGWRELSINSENEKKEKGREKMKKKTFADYPQ